MNAAIGIREQGALDLIGSLLHQGIVVRIQVSGRSMQPFLMGGEIVEIAPLGTRYPWIGDIVLFRDQHGNPLLHRLIRRRFYNGVLHLQTKGDACSGCDSAVPADEVLGYVQRILFIDRTVDLRSPFMRLIASAVTLRSILSYLLQKTGRFFIKQHLV